MVRPSASIDPNCAPRHAPEEPVVGAPTATALLHVWLAYTCGWTREENSRIAAMPRGVAAVEHAHARSQGYAKESSTREARRADF
jgi:hypothetical protein